MNYLNLFAKYCPIISANFNSNGKKLFYSSVQVWTQLKTKSILADIIDEKKKAKKVKPKQKTEIKKLNSDQIKVEVESKSDSIFFPLKKFIQPILTEKALENKAKIHKIKENPAQLDIFSQSLANDFISKHATKLTFKKKKVKVENSVLGIKKGNGFCLN